MTNKDGNSVVIILIIIFTAKASNFNIKYQACGKGQRDRGIQGKAQYSVPGSR